MSSHLILRFVYMVYVICCIFASGNFITIQVRHYFFSQNFEVRKNKSWNVNYLHSLRHSP